jgi:hypothetical protein
MVVVSDLRMILELPIREALPQIRDHLSAQVEAGESIVEDLALIAEHEPIALGELVVGPKAIPGPAMVLAALSQIETLESSIAPKALYQRLLGLSPDSGLDVLQVAVSRHPEAAWLVSLSIQIEGDEAGLRQLRAVVDRPSFIGLCEAYASASSGGGLVRAAGLLKRLEPVLALAREEPAAPVARAGAALLCADPEQPLLAWIAAIRGPDLDDLVLSMIPHMTQPAGVYALRSQAGNCPRALRRLDVVCASLRD